MKKKKSIGGQIISLFFVTVKSFLDTMFSLAWGVSGLFLLNLILSFMLKSGTPLLISDYFVKMEMFIINHIMFFFFVVFAFEFILHYNDFIKTIHSKSWNKENNNNKTVRRLQDNG